MIPFQQSAAITLEVNVRNERLRVLLTDNDHQIL